MLLSYDKTTFSFVRNFQTAIQSGCTICVPISNEGEFLLLHILASSRLCLVLEFSHLNKCVIVSHCCFKLNFLNEKSCGAYFHIPICHLFIFFGEIPLQIFCLILTMLFVFLLLSFKSSLHVLDKSFVTYLLKILPPSP